MLEDIIIYYLKILVLNIYVYYCFSRILNIKENKLKNKIIFIFINLILAGICTYIKFFINIFLSLIVLSVINSIILSVLYKENLGISFIATLISYAISVTCLGISVIFSYLPYRLLNIENNFINLLFILIIQFILLYSLLKIEKFKNGFDFLHRRLNNDFADIIMLNISIAVILVVCLLGMIFEDIEEIRKNLLISFIILGITMFIMIQKTLTMYYKQKLLEDTLQEYQKDIKEKNT